MPESIRGDSLGPSVSSLFKLRRREIMEAVVDSALAHFGAGILNTEDAEVAEILSISSSVAECVSTSFEVFDHEMRTLTIRTERRMPESPEAILCLLGELRVHRFDASIAECVSQA